VAYVLSDKMKIIDLGWLWTKGHWQPVWPAILATARLLVI